MSGGDAASSTLDRLRATFATHRALVANAGSMVGTALVTSLLGVGFWFVAAQQFSQDAVGVAGAAVSAMVLLGFIGTLGLGTLLMGELPQRERDHRPLVNAALLVAGLAGCLLGLGFALLAPLITTNLAPLSASWPAALAFAVGAGLTSATFVLDQSLIGLLRGNLQLSRNVIFAAVKLVALVGLAALLIDPSAAWIYSAWGFGILVSLLILVRFYANRDGEGLRPAFAPLRDLRRSAASHAAVNLALETADLAMPIIVVTLLTATANAGFYIAWLIVGFLVMVPLSLSSVAYAIGSGDMAGIGDRFRFSFLLSLAFGVLALLVLVPGAGFVLEIFGQGYADVATTALQILAFGVFPLTIKTHYVAIHRVKRTLGRALPIAWMGTLLELGGGTLGAVLGGIEGVAWGWLAGLLVEAVVMGPDVFRTLWPPSRADRRLDAGRSSDPV